MSIKFKTIFALCAFGFCGGAFAQMTDSQLISLLNKHQKQGSSQLEIMADLQKRGITETRLKTFVRRNPEIGKKIEEAEKDYQKKQQEQQLKNQKTASQSAQNPQQQNFQNQQQMMQADTLAQDTLQLEKPKKRLYGQNLFANKQLNFEPNLNIATPINYTLGAGDEVVIDIWGNSQISEQLVISPNGMVVLTDAGLVKIGGLTIEEAEKKLKSVYSRVYSDLKSGGTYLKLSLGQMRSIHINVLGEVEFPGSYTVPSLATAFHALYLSGGITDIGSLRSIKVFRAGKEFSTIDIYQYMMKGDNSGDVILKDGDVVLVGTSEILVAIEGEVKRPMKYEIKKGETLADL